ncbi:MAG: putative porin [Steroidobacteraceae bacterium]
MFSPRALRVATALLTLALGPPMVCHADDQRQSLEELRNTVVNLLQALVDQGVISKEKAQQMVKAAQDKAAADAARSAANANAAAKEEEGAVRVPYVPQIVQDQIAKQVEEQMKPAVVADVVKEAKTEKWGIPGALPDWLSRIRLSGDVTLRQEDILYSGDNAPEYNYFAINQAGGIAQAGENAFLDTDENRVRFRGRARLAVESDLTDSITTGLRLVTGNTSDLVSQTQTLDGTAPYAFGLDELYIRLDERNSQRFPWLSVVGGRFLNPYDTPTDLIFHKDLTFTGLAATGRFGLGDGSPEETHLFLTAGGHQLQEIEFSPQDKWLAAAQLGANIRFDDSQRLRVAGGFYDFFNVTGRLNPADEPGLYNYTAPTFLRFGNTLFNIANSPNNTTQLYALASKFRLVNLNATYTYGVGRYTAVVTADAVRNLGFNATAVEENTGYHVTPRTKGYQAEFSFGYPTVLAFGEWRGRVGYRYLQRDAVIDGYTDSDFHFGGTNARGYYLTADYGLSHNLWMRLRYLSANEIDGPIYEVDTLQIDMNARF